MFFNNLKISQKLWVITTTIIVVLTIGFLLYFKAALEKQFREGFQRKGMSLIHTASVNLGPGLYFNDDERFHNILKGLENDPDVSFIYVADNKNKMKYGFNYSNYIKLIKTFLSKNQIQDYEKNLLLLKQSIFFQDEYQGNLIVGLSLNWVKEKVAEQTRTLLIISTSLAVLLIILTSFLARSVSKPLEEAAETIKHYPDTGDELNLQLPVNGNNEITHLSTAINHLTENLDKNIKELNKSKQYLETIFQLSPVPIIIADSLGQIGRVNEAACSFFGVERNVLLQMNIDHFFNQDDLNTFTNRVVHEGQDILDFVTTLNLSDGTRKVVELNIASHDDNISYVKNIIIAIIDITEKIQTQREILHNQTKLQQINNELVQKTNELEQLSSWNKKNAQNLSQLIQISQQMMRATTHNEILKVIVNNGCRLLDAEECMIFLLNKQEQHLFPSITYPKNVLNRIGTSVHNGDSFIWHTFQENEPFVINSKEIQAEEANVLGVEREATFSIVSVPISEKGYRLGVILFIRYKPQSFRVEDVHLLSTLANQAAILLDNIHLVHAQKEKAVSLENALNQLQKSQQQIVQLQKMESLGTLVGGIAHDFNNILGIVIPNADLLRNDANGNANVIRRVNVIADAAQRAADLTRQLLMFSRNQDIQVRVFSTNKLISRLSGMLKRTLGKEYEIKLDLNPNVKNVEVDETRLTQVLINLAVNARDAMVNGGQITIETFMTNYKPKADKNTKENEYVCISMKDTGSGIKSSDLDKIFDPFFTTKTVGKGTGLGLSVVYGIMQSHNGFVEVESKEGEGTAFYLYLPPTLKKQPESASTKSVSIPTGSENILIVDDEYMIRDSVNEILSTLGYTVTTAASGIEAVEIIQQNKRQYHLVIVDMSMPKMNGIQTVNKIKELNGSIKVILSSGRLDRDKMIPNDLDLDGTLPKPYRMKELAIKVREILSDKIKSEA